MRAFSKKQLIAAIATSMAIFSSSASAADWSLTSMEGSWAWGDTQWLNVANQGYVNNTTDLGAVNTILHGPYHPTYQGEVPGNAIFNWPTLECACFAMANNRNYDEPAWGSLTFATANNQLMTLNSLNILTSRSFSTLTKITLDYSADGGVTWKNALNTTTGALRWNGYVHYTGRAHDLEQSVTLGFGGVQGNAFRFGVDGAQVSIHTAALDAVAAVPEPETYAMLIAGLGLIVPVTRRRSKALRPEATTVTSAST